jgi:hypothetical protein
MSNIVAFNEMESMASYIVRSRLFGAKDESQAMSLMLLAQAEGLHPMTAIQDFDIVQGRPARKTHSILARFQAAGGAVAWEEITPLRACGTFSHKQGGSLKVEWTFEQAKKAGLTGKDNWKNYPQAMLRARCIAEGVRAVFPGAIGGMLTVEEAQDAAPIHQPAKDMGTAEVVLSQDWMAAVTACATTEEVTAVWQAGVADIQKAGDKALYDRFKAAVAQRGAELKAAATPAEAGPVEVLDAEQQ